MAAWFLCSAEMTSLHPIKGSKEVFVKLKSQRIQLALNILCTTQFVTSITVRYPTRKRCVMSHTV